MKVYTLSVVLLVALFLLVIFLRRNRFRGRITSERALLLQCIVLGILVGMIFAFLGEETFG
jgi:hypothetical protein